VQYARIASGTARELLAELDAIEQDRPIARQEDVAQMQVAVVLADPAMIPTFVEESAMPVRRF
jgi:hypothetical protein